MSDTFITVVSGLPRSGTSLMMQMLAAGGMPVLTDSLRPPDASNPHGYFEYEPVKHFAKDSDWLGEARGQAVKIVCPLVRCLPDTERYRVLLMKRPIREIVTSQRAMLERLGKAGARLPDDRLEELLGRHLSEAETWMNIQPHLAILTVEFRETLLHPIESARTVNAFLGGSLDVLPMAGAVNGSASRQTSLPRACARTFGSSNRSSISKIR